MKFLQKYFGPSTLVTAAFIGPGTLTVCTISGASHGYSLLWVLLFAIIATVVLQEMAARLGLITQRGLAEAIRSEVRNPLARAMSILLVFTAIIIGNAAYEAGNISGAVLGLQGIFGQSTIFPLIIGAVAAIILWVGRIRVIELFLIGLVIIMSLVFLLTAFLVEPDFKEIARGFVPTLTDGNQLAAMALIGTTIVPYNLFLHASSVSQKWKRADDLPTLRVENAVAIGLGGLISMAIVIASAATLHGIGVSGISEMAIQLQPVLGTWSTYFLGIGLFAAGISSAITAPLAAAYTAKGLFGWEGSLRSTRFRLIWGLIIGIGVLFSLLGYRPIAIIQIAQVANGLLLPVIVLFLIFVCNRKQIMGPFANNKVQNVLSILVVLITLIISLRSLNGVFQFF